MANEQHQRWLDTWKEKTTPWHMEKVNPALERFYKSEFNKTSKVFVPLCGKSIDMVWLKNQGAKVLGVDIAPESVELFKKEQNLEGVIDETGFTGEGIQILLQDIFGLAKKELVDVEMVYDRASLIALGPEYRIKLAKFYRDHLKSGTQILLIIRHYDGIVPSDFGPPYSVSMDEAQSLFSWAKNIKILDQSREKTKSNEVTEKFGVTHFFKSIIKMECP